MAERINRVEMERSIAQMWEYMSGLTGDDYIVASRKASETEAKLRGNLLAQDALDEAAPDLLVELKSYVENCEYCGGSGRSRDPIDRGQPCSYCKPARDIISRVDRKIIGEKTAKEAMEAASHDLYTVCKTLAGMVVECRTCAGGGKLGETDNACPICGGVGSVFTGGEVGEIPDLLAAVAKAERRAS